MTRYGQYKDSGVQWLGEIPAHWKVSKIKRLCNSIYAGGTPSSSQLKYWNGDIPWIPSGCCHDCNVDSAPAYITQLGYNSSSTKLIPANTAIMAMTGATCSQVGYLTFEACANQSVVAYNVNRRKILSRFVFYLLQSMRSYILTFQTGGAQGGINVNDCKNLIIPHIPLVEQDAIVAYLDSEVSKIDEAIKQQRKMIELLNERRQIIINEAVTKGLNPDVKMKDSGIDWIGEMPEHWKIDKLNRVCNLIGSGTTPHLESSEGHIGKIPWLQSGDLSSTYIDVPKILLSHRILNSYSALKVYAAPFVVVAMYGASIGNAGISTFDACVNQACCVLKTECCNLTLLYYIIVALKPHFINQSVGGGQPNISQTKIKQTWIPLPPLEEQNAMVSHIAAKVEKINKAIGINKIYIQKLEERKRIIIDESVTGKIKVL